MRVKLTTGIIRIVVILLPFILGILIFWTRSVNRKEQSFSVMLIPPLVVKQQNETFPLVIYLHGYRDSDRLPDYLMDREERLTHPSYLLIPHTRDQWNNSLLIQEIESVIHRYNIDPDRIYLIGYSMGGSGSFSLANAYYDYNRHLFAGIIRLAGMSQSKVRPEIARKTSFWLHYGLQDSKKIIDATGEAFNFLKSQHPLQLVTVTETLIRIPNHPGRLTIIKSNNKEILKKSEYYNDGHGISEFPFWDLELLKWLFRQRL